MYLPVMGFVHIVATLAYSIVVAAYGRNFGSKRLRFRRLRNRGVELIGPRMAAIEASNQPPV